jgi:hypothetical protein
VADYTIMLKKHFESALSSAEVPVRVADINVVTDDNGLLVKLRRRGQAARRLDNLNGVFALHTAQGGAGPAEVEQLRRQQQVHVNARTLDWELEFFHELICASYAFN